MKVLQSTPELIRLTPTLAVPYRLRLALFEASKTLPYPGRQFRITRHWWSDYSHWTPQALIDITRFVYLAALMGEWRI